MPNDCQNLGGGGHRHPNETKWRQLPPLTPAPAPLPPPPPNIPHAGGIIGVRKGIDLCHISRPYSGISEKRPCINVKGHFGVKVGDQTF